MMPLAQLLALMNIASEHEQDILSLAIDSRKVRPGSLFFAYPGSASDGRDFILKAQEAGAAAIVYEAGSYELPESVLVPAFAVDNVQSLVGRVAHEFFGRACDEMQVFGVTGTNGKTTCCYLLTQALSKLGMHVAMIGTIGNGKIESLSSASHTTPDPIELHEMLANFKANGITQVCMEVSSHALDQGRVNGVEFFCTVFTNLSHDHLDYHGDMASYGAAKQRLFTDFFSELVITNAADDFGAKIIDVANAEFIVSYGDGGDIFADEVALTAKGITFEFEGSGVDFSATTPLIGAVNIPNIEMLVATLLGLSTSVQDIQSILAELKPAPGRMELTRATSGVSVVVDYAHTPDALEKAINSVRHHCEGQLWCVFGCGGDRDQAKRPLMGAAVAQYADQVIVTNDNPRSESPEVIAEQIVQGVKKDCDVILDRASAIRFAVNSAAAQDWILVAGKGHESTQEVSGEMLQFSDREFVKTLLEAQL